MRDGLTQLVIIVVYLLLLLLLGMMANRMFRGTKNDYLLASHSIGPFLLLMSLFGTTMTAFALVGSSGQAYRQGISVYGMLGSSSGIIHSLVFFVIGIKLWSLGRKYGYTTQIQYFRDRLDSDFVGILLFPILVGLVIPYLLIGVMAGGTVIQTMTAGAFPDLAAFDDPRLDGGVPPWLGSLVICAVVLMYVFFGGMRGTAWANAFQTMVFVVLGVVTFYAITSTVGQQPTFLENLRAISAQVEFERITRVEMSKTKFFTYLLVPLSVGMFPHVFQHWLTAKSAESFKVPIVCHPIFIMIVWVPCVLIGIWATTLDLPENITSNEVLPFLVKSQTNAVLGGLLTAGILAAIMSSLDSQFLCMGTIFSNDIVGHYISRDRLSDSQQVLLARVFIVLIVAITYILSLLDYRSVFAIGVWCFSGFSSLFPLVFAALYWRRLTAWGAYASILAMAAAWLYLFRESEYGANPGFTVPLTLGGSTYQILPVAIIFGCSLIALVVVSVMTPAPSEKTLKRHFASVAGGSASK